ncbi:MAG TPA: PKD domain-containing protein [Verrucomicrobiae bacterium]|nr:PKD domain-containing protein [Verrucomicrobiae bacterium]
MKTHRSFPPRSVVSLSAGLLLLPGIDSWASCGTGATTITAVPSLGGSFYRVSALNANGQVAGFSYVPGDLEGHAFRFDSSGIQDLGTLGGSTSQEFGLNNLGQVVGESSLVDDFIINAFLHDGSAIVNLGTLGGAYSTAVAINDAGQIAGHSELLNNPTLEAFIYQGGTMTSLGHLGGEYSTAMAINQGGDVIGSSLTAFGELHGFLYRNGTIIDLTSLGGGFSVAYALNDQGTVVGDSAIPTGETRGFIYSASTMVDVGTLGGSWSSAYAINNAGQVIGTSATTNDAQVNGFIYSSGAMTNLGTLGGTYSAPRAINDVGQVVGEAQTANFTMHAFLWQNGNMVDLNTLLPAGSGWQLSSAYLINNAGRIVGQGTVNGASQWFILDLGSDSANNPPVANAGDDQRVECTGQVTLNGNLSSDPDGDALSFEWSEGNVVLGTNSTITTLLGTGSHTITLRVSDPCGDSALDTVTVEVVADTTAPTISCPGTVTGAGAGNCETIVPDVRPLVIVSDNCTPATDLVVTQSPAAGTVIGSGQYEITVTVTDAAGNSSSCSSTILGGDTVPPTIVSSPASVTSATGDNCQAEVPSLKDLLVVEDNCTPAEALAVVQSPAAGTLLPKGEHLVTVTVADAAGNSTSKHVTLMIVDSTAPTIQSLAATPSVLSPPDNSKVTVNVSVVATDNCDPAPATKIVQVLCNERTDPGDIEIQGNLTVKLIAARKSNGNGRTYTIVVECKDSSGNVTTSSVPVEVRKTIDRAATNAKRNR